MVRNIGWSHDSSNLFHGAKIRGKPPVTTEDLFINYCSYWQAVETVCEMFPQFDVVTTLAFIVESVDTIDAGALVIT